MKKILVSSFIAWAFVFFSTPFANAGATILPGGGDTASQYLTEEACGGAVDAWTEEYFKNGYEGLPETISVEGYDTTSDDLLSCAIKSGKIKLWLVPYFARSILEFLLGIAGLISVLMIIVGAYYYMSGSLSDDKQKGKTIITYAIGGLILTSIAWILVNIILIALTS